ncbi:MAG: hypothetical protein HQ582_28355 [Planctomycetes bacterium]|nr:hypothetical protein [Planctomycetota bacterium]
MTRPWWNWTRRRRQRPKPRSLRLDSGRRRPGVERLEDRLMLTAVAYVDLADDGFLELRLSSVVRCDVGSSNFYVSGSLAESVSTPATSPDGEPVPFGVGESEARLPNSNGNDMELIRIEPSETSASASGKGLIDLTRVLSEPVPRAGRRGTPGEQRVASVTADSDSTGALATSEDQLMMTGPRGGWSGFRLTGLLRKGVGTNPRPAGERLPWLRDSASDEIEGSRGICRAFELATSPEEAAPPAEPGNDAKRVSPSGPLPDESAILPHRADGALADRQPTGLAWLPEQGQSPGLVALREQGQSPGLVALPEQGQSPRLVALRERSVSSARETVFAEMAEPFGDAFLDAVYLDDKRPAHLISLLVVAAVAYQQTQRRQHDETRSYLVPPRRRFEAS